MRNPQPGSTPIEGACEYCGASLVKTWADFWPIGSDEPIRITEARPFCVNGHPQSLPGEDTPPANDEDPGHP